jgi:mono/diheme cytochrome c family protein
MSTTLSPWKRLHALTHSQELAAAVPALLAAGAIVCATPVAGTDQDRPAPATKAQNATEPRVTPVAGPSWLKQLSVSYDVTSLGRGSGTYGPLAGEPNVKPTPLSVGQPVMLTGADIYRLNCQACHRAEGTGAPPEIKSLVPAVEGSSLDAVRRQLREQGKAASESAASAKAKQTRADLYRRVREGGQRMPPLAHLQEADIDSLYAYLLQLAGASDAHALPQRTVSWLRLGEFVVKGTCHICHDAAGPRPTREALLQGGIPPLSVLLEDKPVVDFVTKVRSGSTIIMGNPPLHYRGRMPVFPYLKDQEVAAAYSFLTSYPPQAGGPRR